MRTLILAAGMLAAVLAAQPALAHEPCCLGGYFERPFTHDRVWRRAPTHYYRLIHHRPTYRYVVLARPCRDCRHPR